ncbi:competence type IV pilus minor pilin ComGD [Aquibacillus rhizosphaerae]|uniref:Competence type IV pilus minor pilin ComGD n=1 Tax=Aquibacillus rhizosphaerae TaxID=3051431 RepID=A0ABT7L6R9_9BACI|nr:competence type IV pilus minor pilin ComGD [Aquibacillus sp. LR5S19]MDL4841557.1 competence type IV pilus minor pilin ComGD [Aquibacillus sp. LR5S19]
MRQEQGFTLIETLIVLSIVSLFLVIGLSFQSHSLYQNQANQFFRLFQSDVLYLQQISMVSRDNAYLTILPNEHSYEIKTGGLGEVLVKREYPKNWLVDLNTLSAPISFTINGTIKKPGMFYVKTPTRKYSIYFPFGKGRSYIIENEL